MFELPWIRLQKGFTQLIFLVGNPKIIIWSRQLRNPYENHHNFLQAKALDHGMVLDWSMAAARVFVQESLTRSNNFDNSH